MYLAAPAHLCAGSSGGGGILTAAAAFGLLLTTQSSMGVHKARGRLQAAGQQCKHRSCGAGRPCLQHSPYQGPFMSCFSSTSRGGHQVRGLLGLGSCPSAGGIGGEASCSAQLVCVLWPCSAGHTAVPPRQRTVPGPTPAAACSALPCPRRWLAAVLLPAGTADPCRDPAAPAGRPSWHPAATAAQTSRHTGSAVRRWVVDSGLGGGGMCAACVQAGGSACYQAELASAHMSCLLHVNLPNLSANSAVGQWLFIPGVMELTSLFAERFGTCRTYSFCLQTR